MLFPGRPIAVPEVNHMVLRVDPGQRLRAEDLHRLPELCDPHRIVGRVHHRLRTVPRLLLPWRLTDLPRTGSVPAGLRRLARAGLVEVRLGPSGQLLASAQVTACRHRRLRVPASTRLLSRESRLVPAHAVLCRPVRRMLETDRLPGGARGWLARTGGRRSSPARRTAARVHARPAQCRSRNRLYRSPGAWPMITCLDRTRQI